MASVLMICMLAGPGWCKAQVRSITWNELSSIAAGRIASLTLPGNLRIKGEVVEVRPEGLAMNITRSSDPQAYTLGSALVPRGAVTEISVSKRRRHTWAITGAVIGGVAGGILASAAADYANNEGAQWDGIIAALVIVPAGIGFLAGYLADLGTRTFAVQP